MFEVDSLSFSYSGRHVLRNVAFKVAPGEVVAVAGANGAGKTTLLKCLARIVVPQAGSVLLDGQDVEMRSLKYFRQLGYLPEKVALYEDMTVKGYLKYRAALKGEPTKRIRRRVSEAVERCRLAEVVDRPIRVLSAGLRKRVALADAILLRPKVLLLDDFLSGVDREFREYAGELLADAASYSCVIVTGHEIEAFSNWAKRFLVLKSGSVAADIALVETGKAEAVSMVDCIVKGGSAK
jgi:ABC-2 type transport system ATP-binding protein